jgi:hypothetical protein
MPGKLRMIRVAFEQGFKFPVAFDQSAAAGEGFGGELAEQPRRHALARHGDGLLCSRSERSVGEVFDLWQTACRLQVTHETLFAGGAQLVRRNEFGQEMQRSFGCEVEATFETGKDTGQQVAHTGNTLGLSLYDVAPAADEQPDLDIEFGRGHDHAQIGAGSDLVGDRARVARIGFVLTAYRGLASAIDRQARNVDERESGLGQHNL